MTQGALAQVTCVDFGVAAKPLAGEVLSGDACLVRQIDDDVLLAVVDGIGHGPQAAQAANAALAAIESHLNRPLVQLAEQCHRALVQMRGVAMMLVSVQSEGNLLTWLGIGNVWGGILTGSAPARARWRGMPSHSGIVGYRLPRLQPGRVTIAPGDWLIIATDGVRCDSDGSEMETSGPPQAVATRILSRYSHGNDDALVFAARYRGKGL